MAVLVFVILLLSLLSLSTHGFRVGWPTIKEVHPPVALIILIGVTAQKELAQ